ncbi:winged helix-turn-helix domain-containing protein [Dokdonella sp.]|uniref:winged helix-turn-helix domain-containing protein n=1 Tax=Dokdonella sp. TaxID=2291710 RepID=UPI003526EBF2
MRYQFDHFVFDSHNAQLNGPNGEISLRPITVQVLKYLLENAQRIVGHDELLDNVWGRQEVSIGVVSQSIRELRQALGDTARNSTYIETKHKLGYRFLAQPQIVASGAQPGDTRDTADSPPRSSSGATQGSVKRGWRPLVIATLAAAMMLALVAWTWSGWSGRDEARENWSVEPLHAGRPQEPEALIWYSQGLEALRRDDLLVARQQFERALKREPGSAAAMAALAEVHARAGELNLAREWARSAAADSAALPRSAQLQLDGFRAGLDYRHSDEIAAFQALHQLDPGDSSAGLRLLDALIRAGRTSEAKQLLERMGETPTPSLDLSRLALMKARWAAVRGDQRQRALAAEEALQRAASDSARIDALLELASARLLGGDMAAVHKALERLDVLLAETPWPAASLRRQLLVATLQREEGKFGEAIVTFRKAAEFAHSIGQGGLAATAHREAAFAMTSTGDNAGAIDALTAILGEQATLGDPRAQASTLDVLSIAQQRSGDMAAAEDSARAALQAYLDSGDLTGEASARNTLGMLLARSGRSADAQEQWEKALLLFERGGDRRGEATTRSNLAILYARAGRVDAAREASEAALLAFRDVDATLDVSRLQFNLGVQDRRAGRMLEAESRFGEALQGFTTMGAEDFRLQVIASLAELALLRSDLDGAASLLSSVNFDDSVPAQRRAAIETARARLAALRGENETADAGFRLAMQLRQDAGLEDWSRMSALDLAELSARQGRLEAAEQSARELRRSMLEARDPHAAMQAGVLLAGTLSAQGRIEQAERMLDDLEQELADNPDALSTLRVDLLRASQRDDRDGAALKRVAARAREMGLELLALRAEMLTRGSEADLARFELARLGVAVDGLPPPIPY